MRKAYSLFLMSLMISRFSPLLHASPSGPTTASIPITFEENRGQAPEQPTEKTRLRN
jgi:hypothetical protein